MRLWEWETLDGWGRMRTGRPGRDAGRGENSKQDSQCKGPEAGETLILGEEQQGACAAGGVKRGEGSGAWAPSYPTLQGPANRRGPK